ncbi:endonuclease domain-containing protein [Spirosoma rhododendri]|uniref:Endonuclease domain-containing protein n=1 Tax=Spirosoma rhododendri TaxID=2728024 RepID=A0A7L5DRS7_9BACT|nr:endonuclease domain-containing protein [Spirosoma rhododendri]QJD78350.1 endonuclease domain-containing protein [Spirosoma rhododendri]
MATDMFYGASPALFAKAKQLRLNQTTAEKMLWNHLKGSKLGGFRFKAQHPIQWFIADFYCHEAKLVVELDGSVHDNADQQVYDDNRSYCIGELNITVIRFSNEEVFTNIKAVLTRIRQYLPPSESQTIVPVAPKLMKEGY